MDWGACDLNDWKSDKCTFILKSWFVQLAGHAEACNGGYTFDQPSCFDLKRLGKVKRFH